MPVREVLPRPRGGSADLHVGPGLWAPGPDAAAPFRPTRTQTPRRVRALVESLAAGGRDQTVVTTGPSPSTSRTAPVRLVPVARRRGDDLPLLRTASVVVSLAGSVDTVHLHLVDGATPRTLLAAMAAAARPVVVHLHASSAVPLRTGATASVASRLLDAPLEGRLLAGARLVVAPSTRLAEVAAQAGAREVVVVPPTAPSAPPASAHRPLPSLDDGRRIVAVGPLTARRRPAALVRALARLPADTHLVLLGAGPRRLEVDQQARQLGLGGRVHVVPTLTWQVVTDHLAHASVVTTAALSGEDPTSTLLAMAAGRPVVATGVEGLPDLVSSGVDGVLVPPGDDGALTEALGDVLADPHRAEELGASARRRVAATDELSQAARIRDAVLQAIPERGRGSRAAPPPAPRHAARPAR